MESAKHKRLNKGAATDGKGKEKQRDEEVENSFEVHRSFFAQS